MFLFPSEYDTDQASSGFGDTSDLSPGNVTSQDVVTSHDMTSGRVMTPSDVISSKRQLSEDDRRLNEDCELRRQRELDKCKSDCGLFNFGAILDISFYFC